MEGGKEWSGDADVPGEDRGTSRVTGGKGVEASERANAPTEQRARLEKYEVRTVKVVLV